MTRMPFALPRTGDDAERFRTPQSVRERVAVDALTLVQPVEVGVQEQAILASAVLPDVGVFPRDLLERDVDGLAAVLALRLRYGGVRESPQHDEGVEVVERLHQPVRPGVGDDQPGGGQLPAPDAAAQGGVPIVRPVGDLEVVPLVRRLQLDITRGLSDGGAGAMPPRCDASHHGSAEEAALGWRDVRGKTGTGANGMSVQLVARTAAADTHTRTSRLAKSKGNVINAANGKARQR